MTRLTIQKRLSKYVGSKTSIAYKIANDIATGENKSYAVYKDIIRPVHTSGTGRYTSNLDYTNDTKIMLTFLKVKFIEGNDSKRGGLTGNFIKLLTPIK